MKNYHHREKTYYVVSWRTINEIIFNKMWIIVNDIYNKI